MKTRRTLICLALAWLTAMASPALAAKGGDKGKPDAGGKEHPPGLTCQEQTPDTAFTATDAFSIDTNDTGSGICIDWTTTFASEWRLTITGPGIRGASANVRDSHPGDFCWRGAFDHADLRGGTGSVIISHSSGPLAVTGDWRPIPIAVTDACGTEYTDSAESLVLTVSYRGSGPLKIDVAPGP
jgi:hypothetical protein